jgi:hypothetical protein
VCDWGYARAYDSSEQQPAALQPFLNIYHSHRPHPALSHQPPEAWNPDYEQPTETQPLALGWFLPARSESAHESGQASRLHHSRDLSTSPRAADGTQHGPAMLGCGLFDRLWLLRAATPYRAAAVARGRAQSVGARAARDARAARRLPCVSLCRPPEMQGRALHVRSELRVQWRAFLES